MFESGGRRSRNRILSYMAVFISVFCFDFTLPFSPGVHAGRGREGLGFPY
jgi:hypothetical protein